MDYNVEIYKPDFKIGDELVKFTNIACLYKDKWLFVRVKKRETWELPGGHREDGETILECAERELYEETGVIKYDIIHIGSRKITKKNTNKTYYGYFYLANIHEIGRLPESEVEEIGFFKDIPEKLTYGFIQPQLINIALSFSKEQSS